MQGEKPYSFPKMAVLWGAGRVISACLGMYYRSRSTYGGTTNVEWS